MFTLQTQTGFVTLIQFTGTLEQVNIYYNSFTAAHFTPA